MEREQSAASAAASLLPPPANANFAAAIESNFRRMSILFAVNHGCVTSVLNLAVVLLGASGSFMNGALYIMYAATALVAASAIVSRLGSRGAVIVGSAVYCVYILSFPLALLASSEAAQSAIAILGGGIGGIAAGFLWSAQGAYFAASARLYAEASSTTVEDANAKFAATFGILFLGFEVILKVLPLGLKAAEAAIAPGNSTVADRQLAALHVPAPVHTDDMIVAIAYSIFAILSAVGMLSIWDLDKRAIQRELIGQPGDPATGVSIVVNDGGCGSEGGDGDGGAGGGGGGGGAGTASQPAPHPPSATAAPTAAAATPAPPRFTFERLAAAVLLWRSRPVVLLLAPVQITFGLCAALLGYEVAGKVVKKAFSPANTVSAAGCLSALVALVAAALQIPSKAVSARCGKPPVMLSGLGAFGALGALCLVLDEDQLAAYFPLVMCYVLQGIGRACFEGTNKALYADFFATVSAWLGGTWGVRGGYEGGGRVQCGASQ